MFLLVLVSELGILTDRRIEVSVSAKWKKPHPFAEVVSFFNEFYPEGYGCLVDQVNAAESLPVSVNDSVEFVSKCLPGFELKFLKYLMKWHYFSPRIAFYSDLQNSEKQSMKFDFEPHFDCVQFIDFEKEKTLKEKCVIRPVLPESAGEADRVRGYGVELRPFRYSMEYGVKDSASSVAATADDHADKTRGYLDTLEGMIGKEPSGRRLRRAFFSFVQEIDDEMKLSALRDIAQNWPATAHYVATTEVDKDIEDELEENAPDVVPGSNAVVMNGRVIPISTFDPFTLGKTVQEEVNIRRVLLSDFGLSPPSVTMLTQKEATKPSLAYDIRKGPIIWLNDLENDKKYKRWFPKLAPLFGALNAPPRVRKNLMNVVLLLDPSFRKDFESLLRVRKLISDGYAARFGVILSPHESSEESLRINRGLSELADSFSVFLTKVSANTESIEMAFADAYKQVTGRNWGEFLEQSENFCANQTLWLEESGLSAPAVWVNGKLFQGSDVFDMLEFYVMQSLQTTRELIGTPDFGGDVLDFVLAKSKAVQRSVKAIHTDSPVAIDVVKLPYEQQSRLATFMKEVKYDLEDSEFPLATIWVHCNRNNAAIERNIRDYFAGEHKAPVRIAFFSKLPEALEPMITKNDLVNHDYEAIIIVNGRILEINSEFHDFGLLSDWQSSSETAARFVSKRETSFSVQVNDRHRADCHTFWMMVLLSFNVTGIKRRHFHPNTFDPDSPAVIVSESEDSPLTLECVLDPFSKEFQKMSGFLAAISDLKLMDISVLLNPPEVLESIPTSFYRYIDDDIGVFSFLNESITYSLIPDVPETWMIEQSVADVDLDNILGRELNSGTFRAYYELSNIVLEGTALDQTRSVCDGAQIQLYSHGSFVTDTTVMKNRGYWQLKTYPGLFTITLAAGWTSEGFQIEQTTAYPAVASFVWRDHLLKLRRNANYSSQRNADVKDDGKVHIFAVASGRLYERLAKIMMLSAMKNTNTTVKVWLFKNFLSPQFKQTLNLMCSLYNMEYELVTYRWPFWLRRQSEKQRTTWGYKILFLDVLFPLSLKRVIYIDADQTIRTNLRQLMTMDFNNAPYAFTPFCDSRLETEPFRFWKTGYWKDHLQGKPYHISALFAIDLPRFRQLSAGDWLRYYYSTLAPDSNSLANLDQDLPNYAQDRIPIHSLPQNWLWCETWCSDDTMDSALTIDLCNNPLTKRPKLEIAQTRIAEWPRLDEEARSIEARAELRDEL